MEHSVYACTWAPAGCFPEVGNEGSEGRKSPSRVQGQLPGGNVGVGAKPPEADDIFSKWCINTSTEVLDNICSKNTFQHFQGQVPLLAHACWRPCHGTACMCSWSNREKIRWDWEHRHHGCCAAHRVRHSTHQLVERPAVPWTSAAARQTAEMSCST